MAETPASERRGFLRALGLGAAAAGTAQAAEPVRADSVPSGRARKEPAEDRTRARYRPDSPAVQAFYRTNRY